MDGQLKICPVCGKNFEAYSGNQKYCSAQCRQKAGKKPQPNPPRTVICAWCGKSFETHVPSKIYCSEACAGKAWRKRQKDAKPPMRKTCVICGKAFETYKSRQVTCGSEECRRVQRWTYQKEKKGKTVSDLKNGPIKDRPITETTKLIVGWYYNDDGFTPEQIAQELNRNTEDIQRIFDECGYDANGKDTARRRLRKK